jgi:molybdopterin synthase catalytic subunit
MASVQVRVLFFGLLRDVVGKAEDLLEMPEGATLESVFEHYATEFPRLKELRKSIVLARNQQFSAASTVVEHGDELAFLPPVSGGSGNGKFLATIEHPDGHFFALTREPIDPRQIVARILRPEDGAYVDFEGVVRNNSKGRATRYLDYECYEAMAIRVIADLGLDIASKHAVGRVAIVHRLGRMEIGEASVSVIVASPHRRPAFEAALEAIDRLKKTVPIWKKEYFVDGEIWVEGEWDEALPRS